MWGREGGKKFEETAKKVSIFYACFLLYDMQCESMSVPITYH